LHLRTVVSVDIRDHDFERGTRKIIAAIERHRLAFAGVTPAAVRSRRLRFSRGSRRAALASEPMDIAREHKPIGFSELSG